MTWQDFLSGLIWATIFAIILVVALLSGDADAHEWDRPRDLQPVTKVSPENLILPADADTAAFVEHRHAVFLAELEWVNRGRHIPPRIPQRGVSTLQGRGTSLSAGTVASGVEQWRSLVAAYFGPNTDAALRVMACESHGNPNALNPSSGAAGLFQFLPAWYNGVWNSPFGVFDPFRPETNIAAAAWLSQGGSSWSHWVCKP